MTRYFDYLPNPEQTQPLLKTLQAESITQPSRKVNKPLLLYGAGNLGRMAKQYFDRIGIAIDGVVDEKAMHYVNDVCWQGIPLYTPEEVDNTAKQQSMLAICVANICYSTLKQVLQEQGWQDIVHFYDIAEAYREKHPLSNGWFYADLTDADYEGISRVISQWEDDFSRAHHLQFLAWRHLREDWLFAGANMQLNNRYVIPEVLKVLHDHEVFADIGSHHGETTQLLLKTVDYQYDAMWLFEPDQQNLTILNESLSSLVQRDDQKIHIANQALGDAKSERQFFGGAGYACQLTDIGESHVKVIPFDDLTIPVTFMKLHLEGSELSVLKGARQTLIKHRPIVTATAYHNWLGVYEMADWLMQTLSEYRFYFRLHSGCGTGAVIYAVPEERYQTANEGNNES